MVKFKNKMHEISNKMHKNLNEIHGILRAFRDFIDKMHVLYYEMHIFLYKRLCVRIFCLSLSCNYERNPKLTPKNFTVTRLKNQPQVLRNKKRVFKVFNV